MFTSLGDLKLIRKSISSYIHETPVLTSKVFDSTSGCSTYFKCENFQKMGAFKMRGAMNALLSLSSQQRADGVVTHSSGNFGQAVALAALNLDVKATIVMPSNAPKVKKDAVAGYGASIVECEPTNKARVAATSDISAETGAVILHPSDQKEVIDGNASAALELLESQPDIEAIITPVGGGLLAGTALAAKGLNSRIEIFAGEPSGVDDAYRSLQTGVIQPSLNPVTIADGLRTQLGENNFPIIKKYVVEIIRVEEDEIISAMKFIWERMKIVIEPSSAVAVAAVLKNAILFKNRKLGIIISGGNVDLSNLPF
ncbi:MAG TPA: serine dehydratase [Spirochaeta sp.]|nr:serine dehydratase [Spirochaeta sp.]